MLLSFTNTEDLFHPLPWLLNNNTNASAAVVPDPRTFTSDILHGPDICQESDSNLIVNSDTENFFRIFAVLTFMKLQLMISSLS